MSRVDQGEMRKSLRKIPQLSAGRRIILLGQETDIVAQGQKPFE